MAKPSIFDILNAICSKQFKSWSDLPEEYTSVYNQFMINRFISSYDYLLPLADQLSTQKLSNEAHFTILMEAVDRRKHYFKYDNFKSAKTIDESLLKSIMKNYNIGKNEAIRYNNMLTAEQRKSIVDKWKDFFKLAENT